MEDSIKKLKILKTMSSVERKSPVKEASKIVIKSALVVAMIGFLLKIVNLDKIKGLLKTKG